MYISFLFYISSIFFYISFLYMSVSMNLILSVIFLFVHESCLYSCSQQQQQHGSLWRRPAASDACVVMMTMMTCCCWRWRWCGGDAACCLLRAARCCCLLRAVRVLLLFYSVYSSSYQISRSGWSFCTSGRGSDLFAAIFYLLSCLLLPVAPSAIFCCPHARRRAIDGRSFLLPIKSFTFYLW